ncbi:HpcH/HpaI aldolase/citrate lyase family protein [Parasphingorhabdus cellanae]|uniref:CoA ester lyase n=1 Tax=Parasphingorhabdus cellanae TaxID=2806553 RepID=A0ABX7T543_9SPHN|nr:CoA ester lyase [Parasphingorhabdus cellanae]QTD55882.1 CoA ester lyase [Parasphingorhabdus cellanae]
MISPSFRPRRSCLYMPASNARALEKAKTLAADTIILDLEDAVAPDAKTSARDAACQALAEGGYGNREMIVRVNAMDTPWFTDDIKSICASNANGLLVPKIHSAADIVKISGFIDREGAHGDLQLWAMIEMPIAVLNIAQIAETASATRLTTFVMGFNDLAKEMRAEHDRTLFTPAISQTIMAGRAFDLNILDSVYNDFKDPEGFEQECRRAKAFGFDGKTLIHPAQIEIANREFAPDDSKVAKARAIIAAFKDPANAGKGVITVDGKMTEILHLRQAEQTIALAEAISAASR